MMMMWNRSRSMFRATFAGRNDKFVGCNQLAGGGFITWATQLNGAIDEQQRSASTSFEWL